MNNGFCNRQLPAFTATSKAVVTASIYEQSRGGVYELKSDQRQWEQTAPASDLPAQLLRLEGRDESGHIQLFALSYTSILISNDLGRKWSQVAPPLRGAKINSFLGLGPNADSQLAGTESGLFRWDFPAKPAAVKAASTKAVTTKAASGKPKTLQEKNKSVPEKTWVRVDSPIGDQNIRVLSPLGKAGVAAATSAGVFISADGKQWNTTAPIPVPGPVNNIAWAGDRSLIGGTSSGLVRSDDLGASWEPVTWGISGSSVSAVCQHPEHPRTVFAAQFGVVYQSDDAGNNWHAISPGRKDSSVEIEVIKALAVLPGAPDRLLALTQSQGTFALPLPASPGSTDHSAELAGRTENTNTEYDRKNQ